MIADKPKLSPGLYWRGQTIWSKWSCRRTCGDTACSGTHRESTHTNVPREALRLREQRRGGVGAGKVVTAEVERTTFADLEKLKIGRAHV